MLSPYKQLLNCSFCTEYDKTRHPRVTQLYRVKGYTKPDSTWPWYDGICENSESCWGTKERFWTVLRTQSGQWVFRTQVGEIGNPNQLSNTDELRTNLAQGNGKERLVYSGIATGRHCKSFLPLITSQSQSPARKIVIHMASGEPMPENPSLKQELGTLR